MGASFGLQASGFPSGAQHVPLTVPCGDEKLQSFPLLADLHASRASAGGLGGPPFPSAVWAESPQQAVSAAAQIVRANARLSGKVELLLAFMKSLRLFRQALASPWMNCEKSMWRKCGQNLTISSQLRSPIGGYANSTCPYPGTPAALSRFDGGAGHGCAQCLELAQRVLRLSGHARCGAT